MKRIYAAVLLAVLFAIAPAVEAQREDWVRPFEAHRVIGPLYYVGTYDLGVFLLTSDEGHMLINTGLKDSAPLIRQSIEDLGFEYEDVKVLLTMQAHYDHVAAMASIQQETGAQVWATPEDAKLLESGGATDYLLGPKPTFVPVRVDRRLKDGEILRLGELELKVIFTPGHTFGSSSYALTVKEGDESYSVLIANMNSVNPGTKFINNEKYPNIVDDYTHGFEVEKRLDVDIWVAAHASQYGMHDKYSPGDDYDPERFVDPEGYEEAVAEYEEKFLELVEAEK
ncbi:MAG: subclass B3 metallo-beta-lactamase [Acidobacteria bacterium]|nr:subclass B3 metallo-beta-lactamase [Acidobacteriota bacterium]MDA1234153.1 subclass B3 metallo-beta-lactamase [Acidobacteriota bacterium]